MYFSLTLRPAHGVLCLVAFCVAVASACPGLCHPDYRGIVGNWDSNFGPVHLDLVAVEQPAGSAAVSGHWMETPVHRGEIESGHYNAKTGSLVVLYVETWSKHHGKANLRLDASGKSVTGIFKSDDGSTGTWTWKRKR